MPKGEITIDHNLCRGCGYCVTFCSRKCLEIGDTVGPQGYLLSVVAHPDKCNGCGICGYMCPDCAIKVYKYTDKEKV